MPDPLLTATYITGLILMSRSARSSSKEMQRQSLLAAERAELAQKAQHNRSIEVQTWATETGISAQQEQLTRQFSATRRDRAWPLISTPEDVSTSIAQLGPVPLAIFFAPTPGGNARAVSDSAISAIKQFVRQAYGDSTPSVIVKNEWDILAQRAMDDAAINALALELPQQPFVVLSLSHTSPSRVELLAAYHPADGSSMGETTRLADTSVSLRDLVAETVRIECDEWNERAIPAIESAGFEPNAVAEIFSAEDISNMRVRLIESALAEAGVPVEKLNLDGRYRTERLTEIAQPVLESALKLCVAVLADGHNLLVRGLPPRAISHLPSLIKEMPSVLQYSASHVLTAYQTICNDAVQAHPKSATVGLLKLAMVHAELQDPVAITSAIEDALVAWQTFRQIKVHSILIDEEIKEKKVAPILKRYAGPADVPFIKMFAAALSETRASSDSASLLALAEELEKSSVR